MYSSNYPRPGPPYPQGYAPSGATPPQYPLAGYVVPPSAYSPPPQEAQAYYAAQGRQLFVLATSTPLGGYMAAAQPLVAMNGGDYYQYPKNKPKQNA